MSYQVSTVLFLVYSNFEALWFDVKTGRVTGPVQLGRYVAGWSAANELFPVAVVAETSADVPIVEGVPEPSELEKAAARKFFLRPV